MNVTNKKNIFAAGFGLVEMLVVIAVIGIIAAIAVPNIGKINDSAREATNRRNAQSVASVFAAAQAAGLDFAGADTAATIAAVVTGGSVTEEGPFNGTFFGVPSLDATEQAGAGTYLDLDAANGLLKYTGATNTAAP